MLVSTDVSVVRAMAGRGGRSMRKRFTNSPAMCWASAALPPFPKSRTLLPFLRASVIESTTRAIFPMLSRRKASLTWMLSRKIRLMISSMFSTRDPLWKPERLPALARGEAALMMPI